MFIPLTVGGGVRKVEDVRRLLNAGADKVSINTAAVQNPQLVADASGRYGAQCIVVAIDVAKTHATRDPVERRRAGRCSPMAGADPPGWTRWNGRVECRQLGAGEILLTSMDRDGTRAGFDLALTRAVAEAVDVPVIASGGVGNLEHLADGRARGPGRCGARREHFPLTASTPCARRRNASWPAARDRGEALRLCGKLMTKTGWTRSNGTSDGLVPAIAQEALDQATC